MTQSVRPARRVSVVDEMVEYMTRRIVSGEWPPGHVTPSLRNLSKEAGVSALTVREAIRTLQERGLVETRHGVGTFVRSPEDGEKTVPWMLGAGDVHDYVELVEAREVIEAAIVRFAIERRTPEQLRQLHDIVDRMRASRTETAPFLEADTDFHITLAEAAHNSVLLRSMLAIRGPARRLMAARNLSTSRRTGTSTSPSLTTPRSSTLWRGRRRAPPRTPSTASRSGACGCSTRSTSSGRSGARHDSHR